MLSKRPLLSAAQAAAEGMSTKQYEQFQREVAGFMERNNVKAGCHGPVESESEPFFTWRPCECCGSHLGGNRERYSFAMQDGEQFEADICVDCVYYLAYGQLDDMTMLEMEQG